MDRATLIERMIHTWVEFPMMSCGWCGASYDERNLTPCCEKPFIATNKEILDQFVKQIREDKETRNNVYGANKDGTMRWLITMPPGLLMFLERRFALRYGIKLFDKEFTQNMFAKKFNKWFCVPELI